MVHQSGSQNIVLNNILVYSHCDPYNLMSSPEYAVPTYLFPTVLITCGMFMALATSGNNYIT